MLAVREFCILTKAHYITSILLLTRTRLAYQELILTLSYLFSRFDFELYDTDKSSMEWVDHAVAVNKKPVEVKVIRDRWA